MKDPKNYNELIKDIIERYSSLDGRVDFIPDKNKICFICTNPERGADIGIRVDGSDYSFHKDCLDHGVKQYWKKKALPKI